MTYQLPELQTYRVCGPASLFHILLLTGKLPDFQVPIVADDDHTGLAQFCDAEPPPTAVTPPDGPVPAAAGALLAGTGLLAGLALSAGAGLAEAMPRLAAVLSVRPEAAAGTSARVTK